MLFSRMNDIFAKDTQKSLQKRPGIQRKRAAEVTGAVAAGPPITGAGGRKRKLKVEPPADAHVAATGTPAASEHSKKTPKGKELPAVGVLSSVNVTNELSIKNPAVKVEKTKVEEDLSLLPSVAEEGSNLLPQLIAASFETAKPGETVTTVPLKKEEAADSIAAIAASDASLPLADETDTDSVSNRLIGAPPSVSAEMTVSASSLEREDLDMTSQPDLSEALQAGLCTMTPKGEGPASSDLTKSLRKVRLAKKTTTDVPAKLLLAAAKLPPTTDVTDKLSLTASPAKLSADASPGKLLVAASPAKLSTSSLPAKLLPTASPIKLSQAVTLAEQFIPASPGKLPTSDSSVNMSKANLSAAQLSAKLPASSAAKLPTAAEKVDLAAAVPLELQPKLLPVKDNLESEENSVLSTAEPSGSFLPPVDTTAFTGTGTTTTPAVSLTPQDQACSVVVQTPPIIASAPAGGEEVPRTGDGPSAAAEPVRSGGGVRRTTLGTEVFDFTDDEDVDIPLSNIDFDALNSGIITATAGGAVVPTAGCTAVVDLLRLSGGGSSSSSVPLQISIPPPSPGNQALEAGLGDLLTPRHKVLTSSGGIHHHHYVHHRSSPLKNVFDVSPAVLSRGDAMAAVEAVVGGGGNDTPPPPQQQHNIHLQVQQIGGHRRPSGNSGPGGYVQNMDIMSDDTDTSLGGGRPHGGGGGSNSIEQQQQQQQQQRVKLGKRRRQRRIQDASDGDGDTEDDQLEGGAANSRSSRDMLLSGGGRPKRAKTADSVAAGGSQVLHHAQPPPPIAAAATTRPSSAASGTSTASGGRGGGVEGEGGGGGRLPTVEEDDGKQSPDSQRSNEDKSRWKNCAQLFACLEVSNVF
jgi:hypothetical protein